MARGNFARKGDAATAALSSATPLPVGGQALPQLWAGHQFESELDVYHMQARWYDPHSGRFLSPDPLSYAAGDDNLYRYVGNSTANAVDPNGRAAVSIVGRLTRDAYKGLTALIKREGLSALFQVHHKIGQRFFAHAEYGPWLRKLGFLEDDLQNLIVLPTKELKEQAARRGQPILRAGHGSRHTRGYVDDIVKARLNELKRKYGSEVAQFGEAQAIQNSQARILAFQKELQKGLRDGSIKLQHWDDLNTLAQGGAVSLGGLFMIVPDQFEMSRSSVDALDLGTASHYTGNEGLLGWTGWLVDLANPVEDFKFAAETTEQMIAPLNQWSSGYLHNSLDNHRNNIHAKRYGAIADVPGALDMMHSKRVSDPREPSKPQADPARGVFSDYWHYFLHPFGG